MGSDILVIKDFHQTLPGFAIKSVNATEKNIKGVPNWKKNSKVTSILQYGSHYYI